MLWLSVLLAVLEFFSGVYFRRHPGSLGHNTQAMECCLCSGLACAPLLPFRTGGQWTMSLLRGFELLESGYTK